MQILLKPTLRDAIAWCPKDKGHTKRDTVRYKIRSLF